MPKTIAKIAQIRSSPGGTKDAFLVAFHPVVENFARHQPGFLKCELLKTDEERRLDLTQWKSRLDALRHFDRSFESDASGVFFAQIEVNATDPSGGVEYCASTATAQTDKVAR